MSDVTRNKSKRWVDAKVPSYGDDWGESSESEEVDQLPDLPEVPLIPQVSQAIHNERLQVASLEEQLRNSNISDSDSDSQLESDPDVASDEKINRKGTVKGLWKPISSPAPALPQLGALAYHAESNIPVDSSDQASKAFEEPVVDDSRDQYENHNTDSSGSSADLKVETATPEDNYVSHMQNSEKEETTSSRQDYLDHIDLTKDESAAVQASDQSAEVSSEEHDLADELLQSDSSAVAPQGSDQHHGLQNFGKYVDENEESSSSASSDRIESTASNDLEPEFKEGDQGFEEQASPRLLSENDAIDVDEVYADSEGEEENTDVAGLNFDTFSSSSGSLSTGNWSISSEKFVADASQNLERTASEISTPSFVAGSINLGHWRPETETHRDEFINNLSDRESTVFKTQQSDNETIDNVSSTSVEDLQHSDHSTIHSGFSSGVLERPTQDGVFQEQSHHSNTSNIINESSEEEDALKDESFDSSAISTHALQNLHSSKSAIPESSEMRPTYDLTRILALQNPDDKMIKLRDARNQEFTYQTGLMEWLSGQLTKVDNYNVEQEVLGPHARKAYENVNTGAYHAPSHQLSDLARKHSINFGGGSLLHKKLVHKLAVREKVSETGSLAKGLFGRKKRAKN